MSLSSEIPPEVDNFSRESTTKACKSKHNNGIVKTSILPQYHPGYLNPPQGPGIDEVFDKEYLKPSTDININSYKTDL
jgi:hypothetical protein